MTRHFTFRVFLLLPKYWTNYENTKFSVENIVEKQSLDFHSLYYSCLHFINLLLVFMNPAIYKNSLLLMNPRSHIPVHEPTLHVHEPTLSVHELTLPVHEPTLPVHEPTLPVHELTLPIHELNLPVHELTLPVHELTVPVHEHTSPVQEPIPAAHEPIPAVHEPTTVFS